MISISELKENAENLAPHIEKLRRNMWAFLVSRQDFEMLNIRLWIDGSLIISATEQIPQELLNEFLKEYGLYNKGHFIKNEGKMTSHYELVHWEERT